MKYETIDVTIAAPVASVTLNRPEVHNALNGDSMAELTAAFGILSADPGVRAIVLRGAGKSFCAGADLAHMKQVAANSFEENLEDARALQRMFAAIHECPKVTIARVHGAAIGGGMGLAAVCDIAIAAPEARFGLSEVRLGIVPAVIGPYVLEKIGMCHSRVLFVTGDRIEAVEALRIGLVNEIVAAEELDKAVERKIASVLQAGPEAIASAKQLLRKIARLTPQEAGEITPDTIARIRATPEAQEGIHAFLEKRKPDFAQETAR